jgi:hypothetical protein
VTHSKKQARIDATPHLVEQLVLGAQAQPGRKHGVVQKHNLQLGACTRAGAR